MYYSIQHFLENGIPQLEENQKKFMRDPSCFGECVTRVGQIMMGLALQIVSETLEECDTALRESVRRQANWRVKDRGERSVLTSLGTVTFTHTRFQHKTTGETAYLLDRAMGLNPHARLSPDARESLLREAARGSYQKAGELSGGDGSVSRQTVMRHVHGLSFPVPKKEEPVEKRRVRYLYVEADEDHIALQFHEKKGDVRRWKGRGDNGKIVKLVYVHEGYKEEGARRKELKGVRYFGGLYPGKENETLWGEVKDYIERTYETEAIERIYFQSDGGGWMKKGVGMLGGTFVLDEFHLRKYVRRMARVAGEEGKEEELMGYVERGERKRLREWSEEKGKGLSERDRKRLEKSLGYLERNWKGIRAREKGGGSDGKRHGGACQSCVVGEDELPPNGLERGGGVKAVEAKDPLEKRGRDRGSVSGAGEGGKEGRGGLPERGGADLVGKEKPKKEWEVRGGATSESKRSVKDENILPTDNRKDLQVEWEPQGRGKVRPSGSPSKVTLLKRIVDLAINILL